MGEEMFTVTLGETSLFSGVQMLGVVKQDAEDESVILFSSPPDCEPWVRVPIDTIDQVLLVGSDYRCGDEELPLALLQLKERGADQVEGLVAELLRQRVRVSSASPGSAADIPGAVFLSSAPSQSAPGAAEGGSGLKPSGPLAGGSLGISFGVDILGSQPSEVTVTSIGHVVHAVDPVGGSSMFNVSRTFPMAGPGNGVYLTLTAYGLQPGTWCVWASSNISGGAGPCETTVPGLGVWLGVDGGHGPHCNMAFTRGAIKTLGTSQIE